MHPSSLHYQFHPDSIGWLHRRHANGEPITKADIDRLAQNDDNFSDPLFRDYLRLVTGDKLKLRRGRKNKRASGPFMFRLVMADVLIKDRTAEIKAEREQTGRKPTDFEPCVQAADEIGPMLCLPRGRSLLNAISALKNGKNIENSRDT